MICENIIKLLESHSPLEYAENWDNVGLLVGSRKKDIRHIYIALDATEQAIEEAIVNKADFILTHHPLIFQGVKKICEEDFIAGRVIKLIQHDICYYAMHTNFDISHMADLASGMLELNHTEVLKITLQDEEVMKGIGKIGYLSKEMSLRECAEYVKESFDLEIVNVFGDLEKVVKKIAICPGSGKSMIEDGIRKKADVYITGDIGHHDGLDAVAKDMCVIDGGHYGIEKLFIPYMSRYLKRKLPDIHVTAQQPIKPFSYI